uniref:Eva-1 homolog A, regulator of programmed cell death n=1 Tax=Zonotrichia albicollis TaxID=44394 RepID=A0A8D2M2A3_ZONAL
CPPRHSLRAPALPQTRRASALPHSLPPSRPAAFGEDVTALGTPHAPACQAAFLLLLSPRAQLPARCQERREAKRWNNFLLSTQPAVRPRLLGTGGVPKKLLHETQAGPTNQQGHQKPRFPLQPRVFDPNVIGDGVFLSDVSPSNIEPALPEKKKGRSATFYPVDNTPLLLPVDETEPPGLSSSSSSSSMEPVGVGTEMALLSNILAAYAFITENPERAALYFVSGVCIGLVLTLLALVLRVSCRTDCKRSSSKKPPRERESDSDSSDSDDDSDTTSDLSARRHRRFERTLNMNVFTSAEELERAQRLEERERIIREIWMNGQPDIPGTRSLNRYY